MRGTYPWFRRWRGKDSRSLNWRRAAALRLMFPQGSRSQEVHPAGARRSDRECDRLPRRSKRACEPVQAGRAAARQCGNEKREGPVHTALIDRHGKTLALLYDLAVAPSGIMVAEVESPGIHPDRASVG